MTRQPWWWSGLKPQAIWGATRLTNEVRGLVVTSAKRTVVSNDRVHGIPNSGHLSGWCTDHGGRRSKLELGRQLAERIGCRQALIHDSGSGIHLHVDWRSS